TRCVVAAIERQACADRRRFGRYRQDCSCCARLVTERAFRHRLRETDGTPAGRHLHHRGIARYMDLFSMGHRFGVPAADPPRRGLTKLKLGTTQCLHDANCSRLLVLARLPRLYLKLPPRITRTSLFTSSLVTRPAAAWTSSPGCCRSR